MSDPMATDEGDDEPEPIKGESSFEGDGVRPTGERRASQD